MEKERRNGRNRGGVAASSSSSSSSSATIISELEGKEVTTAGGNKLERMAEWVSSGLHTAFFISMDRFACVKLDTLEEPFIYLHRPLLLSQNRNSSSSSSSSLTPSIPHPSNSGKLHHRSSIAKASTLTNSGKINDDYPICKSNIGHLPNSGKNDDKKGIILPNSGKNDGNYPICEGDTLSNSGKNDDNYPIYEGKTLPNLGEIHNANLQKAQATTSSDTKKTHLQKTPSSIADSASSFSATKIPHSSVLHNKPLPSSKRRLHIPKSDLSC